MPNTVKAAAVVLVTRSENGTVMICDANGKSRTCKTTVSYVQILNEILDDPTLPKIEEVHPHQANVEEAVVAGVKEVVPPFLRPLVRPGLQTVGGWLKALSAKTTPSRTGKRGRRRKIPRTTKGRAA